MSDSTRLCLYAQIKPYSKTSARSLLAFIVAAVLAAELMHCLVGVTVRGGGGSMPGHTTNTFSRPRLASLPADLD